MKVPHRILSLELFIIYGSKWNQGDSLSSLSQIPIPDHFKSYVYESNIAVSSSFKASIQLQMNFI